MPKLFKGVDNTFVRRFQELLWHDTWPKWETRHESGIYHVNPPLTMGVPKVIEPGAWISIGVLRFKVRPKKGWVFWSETLCHSLPLIYKAMHVCRRRKSAEFLLTKKSPRLLGIRKANSNNMVVIAPAIARFNLKEKGWNPRDLFENFNPSGGYALFRLIMNLEGEEHE